MKDNVEIIVYVFHTIHIHLYKYYQKFIVKVSWLGRINIGKMSKSNLQIQSKL